MKRRRGRRQCFGRMEETQMRKIGFEMTDEEFLNKHSWPIERSMAPACDTMRDFDMTEREIARALRLIADDLERPANLDAAH
jgi:hypothetical protein